MFERFFKREFQREVLTVLFTIAIAVFLNYTVVTDTAFLNFYNMVVVIAAFFFGRRVAVLSAMLCVTSVVLIAVLNGGFMEDSALIRKVVALTAWGSFLVITAYLTGYLAEKREETTKNLRETYHGVLQIITTFIGNDKYTQSHSYRVSMYAMKLGTHIGLTDRQMEDLRAAALIHDVGKLKVSREVLYKASRLTTEEYEELKSHLTKGFEILRPVSGTLRRVIDIVLAHHDKYDGTGYRPTRAEEIPIEARVLTVADVYDALTSDRPYRKAMDPFQARQIIVAGSGKDFDPDVVRAFERAFMLGDMEISRNVDPLLMETSPETEKPQGAALVV
jgi:putative nucleotidyltransferase with HDIG domain